MTSLKAVALDAPVTKKITDFPLFSTGSVSVIRYEFNFST
jgi:hypothetical protein